jgi:hypothetical protein
MEMRAGPFSWYAYRSSDVTCAQPLKFEKVMQYCQRLDRGDPRLFAFPKEKPGRNERD